MNANETHDKLLQSLKESLNLLQESYDEFLEAKSIMRVINYPIILKAYLQVGDSLSLFENMYALIGEKLLGYKLNASTEMNAVGFQKKDREKAQILTNILKSITQTKDYQINKQKCDLDLMCGICAAEVWLSESEIDNDLKITIKHIPINALYIDPYSQKEDGSDRKYYHKVLYNDKEDMIELYGKENMILFIMLESMPRERVRYFESFVLNLRHANMIGLYGIKQVLCRLDKSIFDLRHCPIVIRKLYVDSANAFYGIFRNVKPHQDYVNFAENRMANMLRLSKDTL